MKQKYEAYLNYDYNNDTRYQQYLDGIYPQPTPDNIITYRKKFYKKLIDPDFDVNYKPYPGGTKEEKFDGSWIMNVRMMFFMFFCCTLPVCVLVKVHYHSFILLTGFLIGLLRRHGFIKLSAEYWFPFLFDDEFNDFISLFLAFISFFSTIIVWIPLFVVSLCRVAERVNQMTKRGNKAAWLLNLLMHFIHDRKESFMLFKDDLEIYVGFYLIIGLYMGWISLLYPILYWQIMQIRYLLNKRTYKAFIKLGKQMDELIESPNCLTVLKWLLKGLKKIPELIATFTNLKNFTQHPHKDD